MSKHKQGREEDYTKEQLDQGMCVFVCVRAQAQKMIFIGAFLTT